MNKELEEKVLKRFKRQHQFKTVYTDTICNNCKLMFTELVKLQTILHDNIENCELKAPKKHPILKSKKVQPAGNGCNTESTATKTETVTFSEQTTSHDDNQAKEIQGEAIDKGLTKKIRVPSAKSTPSPKLPASKVLFRSISNLEDGRTRRISNTVDDRTGKCSGDVARKRVSFNDPLMLASPPPSSPKLTETTLKSILKKGSTFVRMNVCENDSSSQPSLLHAGTQVFDLSDTGECSYISPTLSVSSEDEQVEGTTLPLMTNPFNIEEVVDNVTDLGIPANQVMEDGLDFPKTTSDFSCDVIINELSQLSSEEDYSESDSGSLVSVLNMGTHYLSDDELSVTSEDVKYMDKVVPQAADCLPDNKESEQITPPALSLRSQSDGQVEVGYTTLPPLTDTIDSNEVMDNVADLLNPANQVIDDGIDLPKTASDCDIMINQPSQISTEEDYSKIDEDLYYENLIEQQEFE
ncbi:uncharacterized protein LOC116165844 [Photinus pyralis]|uniref:uncharacterized protein LOC116165844 n=1 Tax=Photinus pyralis TaxID=7054 RepID=UPI0012677E7C|nr:uncharacterized protein LOC116165844 [Photinus pyralis]